MSSKYSYPAIFKPEEEGGYFVLFPDLEGCFTCGDNMADALYMAEDALGLVLEGYEMDSQSVPAPSKVEDLKPAPGEIVKIVSCDTSENEFKRSLKVTAASVIDSLTMLLTFSTGEKKIFDASILSGSAFKPLEDESVFKNFKIVHGVVTWMDEDIDCAPEYMYRNSYSYE